MKIDNKTTLITRQLHTLITAVCDNEMLDAAYRKRLFVRVKNLRCVRGRLGYAYYGRAWMQLNIPKNRPVDVVQLAAVIGHELAHTQNVKHRNMRNATYGWETGWRDHWQWAAAFPVEDRPTPPPLMKVDIVSAKLEHARLKMEAWQRRDKSCDK